MAGRKKDRGLGRGLSALMNDIAPAVAPEDEAPVKQIDPLVDAQQPGDVPAQQPGVHNVAISRVARNPDQPRKHFDRNRMDDLVASIQQKGVLQPILVRPLSGTTDKQGTFQIVAGERRYQASLKAGLTSIPIIVRELSDRDVLEIGVIENVQRSDLNPMEEALAYEALIRDFGRTQAEIATTIGKSRAHVANTVRLTGLTKRGRELLVQNKITAGHARMLLTAEDPDALAESIVREGWSVREAERFIKAEVTARENPGRPARAPKPSDIIALEQKIRDTTGFATDIRHKARGGEIRIKYKDLEQLESLLTKLGAKD